MQGCFSFNLPGSQGWAVEPLLTQVDPLDPKSSPVQLSTQLATPWLDGMQSGPEGCNCLVWTKNEFRSYNKCHQLAAHHFQSPWHAIRRGKIIIRVPIERPTKTSSSAPERPISSDQKHVLGNIPICLCLIIRRLLLSYYK